MRISYGEKETVTSGPIYKSYQIDENKITISFDPVGSGLISNNLFNMEEIPASPFRIEIK